MATPARILITGADGFVGRNLVPVLRRDHPDAVLEISGFDVTDHEKVNAAVARIRPEACIHLAAIAAVPDARRDIGRSFAVNLDGTLNLAGAILEHAPDCLLIYFGSGDCYGAAFQPGLPVDEATAMAPMNTYAASKAAADLALGALAAERGLRLVRLRPFNQIGRFMPESYALGSFAAQLRRIRGGVQAAVLRVGNLDAERDMLHVADVARAVSLALSVGDRLPNGIILNLASGTPRRIGEVLDDLIARAGLDVRIETDPSRLRPSDIPRAIGNADAAKAMLGWVPEIPYGQWLDDLLAGISEPAA